MAPRQSQRALSLCTAARDLASIEIISLPKERRCIGAVWSFGGYGAASASPHRSTGPGRTILARVQAPLSGLPLARRKLPLAVMHLRTTRDPRCAWRHAWWLPGPKNTRLWSQLGLEMPQIRPSVWFALVRLGPCHPPALVSRVTFRAIHIDQIQRVAVDEMPTDYSYERTVRASDSGPPQ
jgi:hypothetical protein